ncbi:MAG TPA: CHAT domain-containing protein [Saprospiraceae bacterium]|nr:CHAT domain-containing protein [Saprospiraceae bacterium]HMP26112.1 CHAT domain-containing protein [Saprospiraceae bacterium]
MFKSFAKYGLLAGWLLLWPLSAQNQLEDWDEKIAFFENNYHTDSLAYYYHQKADYYKKHDNLTEWLYCHWDWQAAEFTHSPRALAILDTALQTGWRSPSTADEAEALLWVQVNRGYHLFQLGKVFAAVQAYEQGLALYQQYQFPDFAALDYLYLPLGAHYTRLGDNEKARALYENAIQTHRLGPQDAALVGVYNNLGLTYWNEGEQQQAITTFQKGLECQDIPLEKLGLLQLSLSQSYLETAQMAEAEASVASALDLLQQVQTTAPDTEGIFDYLSGAYLVNARLLRQQNQAKAALGYLRQALRYGETGRGTQQHRDIAKIRIETGRCYLQMDDPEQAITAFNAALADLIPGFEPATPNALPKPAQLYQENAIYEALEGKADALTALYRKAEDFSLLRVALDCHRLAGQTEQLLRQLLQYESSKINLLSQSRRRAEKAIDLTHQLYQHTGDTAFLYAAWTQVEQVKSVILLEAVQRNRFQEAIATNDTLLAKAREKRQQAAYFERQLLLEPDSPQRPEWLTQRDELLRHLAVIEQTLQNQYPAWAALRQQSENFDGADIRALRATMPRYAVVEYFVGAQQIDLFGQAPDGQITWARIAQPDSVANQTQALLASLQSRAAMQAPEAYRRLAHEVYQTTVQPVLKDFSANVENLLIVPDAWLAFLPFEALYETPAPETNWTQAPFLLRKYGIHYAFSLAVLENQGQMNGQPAGNVLQIAPRFAEGQRGLSPLLYSSAEAPVSEVCRSHSHTDARASFAQLQQIAAGYRVVHLSTHAGVDTGGLLPRVELFDRSIYLPEVYALPLQADLVVLSACQTALGQFRRGEGVMSLSRAFTYAGAKGLVSSLWTINEAATSDLLRRMYAQLQTGAAKPEALRQAKLAWLEDPTVPAFQKSPYYWSGLIYIGDASPINWHKCSRYFWGWSLVLGSGVMMLIIIFRRKILTLLFKVIR